MKLGMTGSKSRKCVFLCKPTADQPITMRRAKGPKETLFEKRLHAIVSLSMYFVRIAQCFLIRRTRVAEIQRLIRKRRGCKISTNSKCNENMKRFALGTAQ